MTSKPEDITSGVYVLDVGLIVPSGLVNPATGEPMDDIRFYVALDAGLIGQIVDVWEFDEQDYVNVVKSFYPRMKDGRIELGYRPDIAPEKVAVAPRWAVLEMRYFTQADGEWIDRIVPVDDVDALLEFLVPHVWSVHKVEYYFAYAPAFEVSQVKALTSPQFFSSDAIRESAYPAKLVYEWIREAHEKGVL
ncbi:MULTISPECIES: hypothetical protein [Actinotignum]|uniref:hypothetical protein n=1 Tax=Actinotignum TaxID=1653174 RepID=UPI002A83E9E9|nr:MULTISPECIES: hypothetical protein [Actinotignum]MDY5127786.1 hypothetical protein [Actinotignum sp. SLA_B059]MDY5157628.1 hypothetical protein [Actinotignum timonense]